MSNLTAESARKFYSEARQEAARLRADAVKLRDEATADGKNLLADEHKELFAKIDEAFKASDLKADEAEVLRGRLEQLEGWSNGRAGGERLPYTAELRGMLAGGQNVKSYAHRLTSHAEFASWQKSLRSQLDQSEQAAMKTFLNGFDPVAMLSRDEFRALLEFQATTITGGGSTSAGPFIVNDLQPGFVPYARKRPTIAALVATGETDSDVVEYVTQTAVSSGAAETAEDTAAPESAITFATNTTNVREITHFIPVTLRAMADAGQVRSIVENDLAGGVIDRLDTQLYSGDGTGVNLTGITITSGINTQALGGDTRLDCLHKALTQIRVAAGVFSEADAIVMHPNDWQKIRLEKDANGQYLLGPAGMSGDRQVWGIPVIASTVATAGAPLVGDFAGSSRLWVREGLAVTSGLDGNDFTKRRISLLAAIRVAFAVPRPTGFTAVSGF